MRPESPVVRVQYSDPVEIKSGYGLDLATEAKMLRVARRLGVDLPVTVHTSFLGAHAVPPEFTGRQGDHVDLVAGLMMG
jgi:imidazolonepropionase